MHGNLLFLCLTTLFLAVFLMLAAWTYARPRKERVEAPKYRMLRDDEEGRK